MKTILYVCLAVLSLSASLVSAQEILTISEKDRDGNYRDKDNPGQIKQEFTNNRISDINSVLDIKIDLAAVNGKVSGLYSERLPEGLADKISAVLAALQQRHQSLLKLEEIVGTYNYESFKTDTSAYDRYIADLAVEARALTAILKIDERIKAEYFRLAGAENLYSGVYEAAANVLADLETEFQLYTRENGIYIQFGGWLVTKNAKVPIHLEGFDDIAPQTPFEVDRWQFIPTEEQLKELEEVQRLAKENRDLGLTILKVTARNYLNALKALGEMKLKQLNEKLAGEIARLEAMAGNTAGPEFIALLESIKSLKSSVAVFTGELETRLAYYQNLIIVKDIDAEEFLARAEADIQYITGPEWDKIKEQLRETGARIAGLKPALLELTDSLRYEFKRLENEFNSGYKSLEALTTKKAKEILYGVELDLAALEFGTEVYKLTLSDLPSSAELDLINTGARSDGDRLVLKMVVSDNDSFQSRTLDSREIYLFRVLPHVITTVGVVFADPLTETKIQAQFQMAPSFNFLFKGLGDQKCRRKSVAYNRLFDWGIGIHLAAPDFDKDDVPEIAAGVVVSTLHDYLQGGLAYNIFTGDPYWFFGLRFPIPSFNIGASSQTE